LTAVGRASRSAGDENANGITYGSRVEVPVLLTELGRVSSGSAEDNARQAYALVKTFTMAVAPGVARINWYEARDGQGGFWKGDKARATEFRARSSALSVPRMPGTTRS
jgi:hypothetical protein